MLAFLGVPDRDDREGCRRLSRKKERFAQCRVGAPPLHRLWRRREACASPPIRRLRRHLPLDGGGFGAGFFHCR